MTDFQFLQNPLSKRWVILAPRRAKRPDVAKGTEPVCPFCPGREKDEKELCRVGGKDNDSDWKIRILPNKFPFAPIHEIIVHSPHHHKNFDELPLAQTELILQTYRQRYNLHSSKGFASRSPRFGTPSVNAGRSGQVYIFHNHGEGGGESLPHPHTQLAVVPENVKMDMPRLASISDMPEVAKNQKVQETEFFTVFCPKSSQWPDEVWVAPKKRGRTFGEIENGEVTDLARIIARLIRILDLRHGEEFPFNFYIYPGGDWYWRLIPRVKSLGGFEIGTGIFINTQDPTETITFIKEHFENPDIEKIKRERQAEYGRGV